MKKNKKTATEKQVAACNWRHKEPKNINALQVDAGGLEPPTLRM